jgi:hypothetical protein
MIVLDSGAVTFLARRDRRTTAYLARLRQRGFWPPVVPTVVLTECLTGSPQRDATANSFLKGCDLRSAVPERLARRAAELRTLAHRGSAVDAILVAIAEPGDIILTSDGDDLRALAAHADDIAIEVV